MVRPEKIRVEGREMEDCRVRGSRRGSSVPRSPREPESSERGWLRRVRRLWVWIWRRWVRRGMVVVVGGGEGWVLGRRIWRGFFFLEARGLCLLQVTDLER